MKNKQYYDVIYVSRSSGVKKRLKARAEELGMSFTDILDHLLLLEEHCNTTESPKLGIY